MACQLESHPENRSRSSCVNGASISDSHKTGLAAYAEALGIPVTYLYRMPATGHSLDELAADLSPQDIQKIVRAIEKLKRAS